MLKITRNGAAEADAYPHATCLTQGRPRVGNGAMHIQYQLEVNRCRNEEVIEKGNFGWVWPMWAGHPRIDHIVIREVQNHFEVNRCRNEEIIVKGNFGWEWSMWAERPRVGNGAMHNVQYQFEVNRCRNEEVNFQGSSAYSVGGDSGQDGQMDRQTAEITTISPRFSKSVGIMIG
ncbi:hypothetical protein DPMN_024505 [Dreissena polymorpha]|uniref:Uncharacterized protein n=1 Tax=Dreissena polymorpha TaxID=45954 RepID=A0A9D4LPW8_DREPO|nr:hypothetical protein DPMN_024505 [Dreissena polymorpha]